MWSLLVNMFAFHSPSDYLFFPLALDVICQPLLSKVVYKYSLSIVTCFISTTMDRTRFFFYKKFHTCNSLSSYKVNFNSCYITWIYKTPEYLWILNQWSKFNVSLNCVKSNSHFLTFLNTNNFTSFHWLQPYFQAESLYYWLLMSVNTDLWVWNDRSKVGREINTYRLLVTRFTKINYYFRLMKRLIKTELTCE